MMNRKSKLAFFAPAALATFIASAAPIASLAAPAKAAAPVVSSALNLEAGPAGSVEFLALGKPSLLRIKGKGQAPKGSVKVEGQKLNGTFAFDLKSLDTGIDLRNEHMKDKYLEVGKHPEAKLVLKDVQLPATWTPTNPTADAVPFQGVLTLHGQEKPITGTFSSKGSGDTFGVDAKFDVKIDEFGIETPSYAGIKVTDSVNVTVSVPDLKKVSQQAAQ